MWRDGSYTLVGLSAAVLGSHLLSPTVSRYSSFDVRDPSFVISHFRAIASKFLDRFQHTTWRFDFPNFLSISRTIVIYINPCRLLSFSLQNDSFSNLTYFLLSEPFIFMGRDISVSIATRYGLAGPGIESRWGARFSAPVQTDPGAHPASCTMGTGSYPGAERPRSGFDHQPPSSAEVKERVELYFSSPFWPSWPVLGWTLSLSLPLPLTLPLPLHTSSLAWISHNVITLLRK
jgi:hypothetical protein